VGVVAQGDGEVRAHLGDSLNDIERVILDWIRSDESLLKSMRGIARNEGCGHGPECEGPRGCDYEYGDDELSDRVIGHLSGDAVGIFLGGAAAAQRASSLRGLLPPNWEDGISWGSIRSALLAHQ
jgi:hypothetical protein